MRIPKRSSLSLPTACLISFAAFVARARADENAAAAAETPSPVLGRWKTTLYGFAELAAIRDSTQSFNEGEAGGLVARPHTYGGDHDRFMLSARHSRLGFKLAAPEFDRAKASALLEFDFLGSQPATVSEASFFNSPGIRIRHFAFKVETPYLDVLAGQTWHLFGWLSYFTPNTVEIQGLPAQVYSRVAQLRLSHMWKGDTVNVELAAGAMRPPQRNAGLPDGAAGVRLVSNDWKGVRTAASAGTSTDGLGIGVSGVLRQFGAPELSASPTRRLRATGRGVSFDALLPVVPASASNRANGLTLTGSYVMGTGIADLYSSFNGGVGFPSLPNPGMVTPAPSYPADVDNGLVGFDASGAYRTVDWKSFMVGAQYYLPPSGKVWLALDYNQADSDNAGHFGSATKIVNRLRWFSTNLFWDALPSVRAGLAYEWLNQRYADGVKVTNHRVQLIGLYLF